jgi:predicted metal-dependent hydrolase
VDDGYEYTVRESKRARRVSLRMRRLEGLEVVVPAGFDHRHIPHVLEAHGAWIERQLARTAKERALMVPDPPGGRPTETCLPAIDEVWRITYRPTQSERVSVREISGRELLVSGRAENADACRAALRRWLKRRAQATLVPWLERLADEHGFEHARTSVRLQRSRWASCSSRGTITLNAKSLFLPPELVEHVLLHELCHTVHPNHSGSFHALLASHDPTSAENSRSLRDGWRHVPRWTEER